MSAAPGTHPLAPDDLVGTWRLRAWVAEDEDGVVAHPMGETPEGVLVYTADGTMITTIARPARQPIDGGDMLAGPSDQQIAAMTTFIAYSGSFRIDGDDVLHDVRMSLFPNWVGTQQRRHVAFSDEGRLLSLSADPFLTSGRMSAHRLTWERVAG